LRDPDQAGMLGCPFLIDEMQPRAVVFSHLFCRNNIATKVCEANKLMLDSLQPFIPPPVSDLSSGLCAV
jgi:hypothetical protein